MKDYLNPKNTLYGDKNSSIVQKVPNTATQMGNKSESHRCNF